MGLKQKSANSAELCTGEANVPIRQCDETAAGGVFVRNSILLSPNVLHEEKLTLAYVASLLEQDAEVAFNVRFRRKVANKIGVPTRRVNKHIKRLIEVGVLQVDERQILSCSGCFGDSSGGSVVDPGTSEGDSATDQGTKYNRSSGKIEISELDDGPVKSICTEYNEKILPDKYVKNSISNSEMGAIVSSLRRYGYETVKTAIERFSTDPFWSKVESRSSMYWWFKEENIDRWVLLSDKTPQLRGNGKWQGGDRRTTSRQPAPRVAATDPIKDSIDSPITNPHVRLKTLIRRGYTKDPVDDWYSITEEELQTGAVNESILRKPPQQ